MQYQRSAKRTLPQRSRDLLPESTYLARCTFIEKTLSTKKGTPTLVITLVVQAGQHKGAKIWDRVVLLPSVLWKLDAVCEGLGVTEAFDTDNAADLLDKFTGNDAFVTVKHEESEYVNKDGNTVKRVQAVVSNWRPTSETQAKVAAADAAVKAKQAAEDAKNVEDKEGTDGEDEAGEQAPPF